MGAPAVPFVGQVNPGQTLAQVVFYKRGLSRAGLLPWLGDKFTGSAGVGFVAAVKQIQKTHGLDTSGVLGQKTHDALRKTHRKDTPGEWAFDMVAIGGMEALYKAKTTRDKIDAYWRWWDWFILHNAPIHYSQVRPQPDLVAKRKPPALPAQFDCSDTAGEYIPWAAGCLPFDPQFGFTGFGNTDSLRHGGTLIQDFASAPKGSIVLAFYGPTWDDTQHVTAVRDLTHVYSNGSESAPDIWTGLTHGRSDLLGLRAYPVA